MNTKNVIDIGCIFQECSLLSEIPDISKWNTENLINMNSLFYKCSNLISLPNISKWNKKLNKYGLFFSGMFIIIRIA